MLFFHQHSLPPHLGCQRSQKRSTTSSRRSRLQTIYRPSPHGLPPPDVPSPVTQISRKANSVALYANALQPITQKNPKSGYSIFFCWYCNALRHRRAARRSRHHSQPDDAEAGIPLQHVDPPAPASDTEDKISYIARTGHVPGTKPRLSIRTPK
jgi:hypothetical protein